MANLSKRVDDLEAFAAASLHNSEPEYDLAACIREGLEVIEESAPNAF